MMKYYVLFFFTVFCCALQGRAQTPVIITGAVTDSATVPLSGVTVSIKRSATAGIATDFNGRFSLAALPTDTLVFSSVGYAMLEMPVRARTELKVQLQRESKGLDDVVVVAFGKQKRKEVVGAVTTVRPGDLKIPASNLTTALAGRVAGLIAYQQSGEPGADNADFFIRGVTTFGYKKDPLILIDNIEQTRTDLARLQVDDIASFTIMKDATATALYGARGANGVILITTKEGKEGRANISLRLENSISSPTKNVELADPITYMRLHNEAILTRNPLGAAFYSNSKIDNTIAGTHPYVYPVTDWQEALLKDQTSNQRANLNVSGGGKVARYYISGAFTKDNGILKVDPKSNFNSNANLKTYSLRSNININLTKTTEITTRLSGSFDDYTGPIDGGAAVYKQIMRTSPTLFPAYYPVDDDHRFVQHIMFGNYGEGDYLNPYANLQKGYKDYSRSQIDAQFQILQNLSFVTPGLSVRTMINTARYSYFDVNRAYNPFYYTVNRYDKQTGIYGLTLLNEDLGTEYLGYSEGKKDVMSTVYGEAAANYNRVFDTKHSIGAMLVGIMRNRLVGNAGDLQSSLPFRNLGLSGRATYTYDSRYSIEFNFGYNGSERFYKDDRFGFFPSAGIAWNAINEKFMEPLKSVVTDFKLRATYGYVGNDEIGDPRDRFFYLSNVDMNSSAYRASFGFDNGYSRTGVAVSRYANFDISWETARKTNIGMQMSLFNKLSIEADYFTEYRTNILMSRATIPSTMGLYAPVRANVGKAAAHGIDGNITYTESLGRNGWLKGMANFTYATSEYKKYEQPSVEKYQAREGYSINQVWGYIAERLFVDDAEVANSPTQNFGETRGGDIKYKDVNGDGQITTLDLVPIGHPNVPEIVYGFGFSGGYKGFDASFFFQGSARSSFWIDPAATAPFVSFYYKDEIDRGDPILGRKLNNQLLKAYADNHWSEDNRNLYALWPRLDDKVNNNNAQTSTWFMRNGAFLRLKQVEIGYSLPRRWMEKMHMAKARFYVNAINLLTFSHFKLWDVEMGSQGLGYPIQKVINGGVMLSF
jgi:TonB-linked SusC/RagA family outer membrane protein